MIGQGCFTALLFCALFNRKIKINRSCGRSDFGSLFCFLHWSTLTHYSDYTESHSTQVNKWFFLRRMDAQYSGDSSLQGYVFTTNIRSKQLFQLQITDSALRITGENDPEKKTKILKFFDIVQVEQVLPESEPSLNGQQTLATQHGKSSSSSSASFTICAYPLMKASMFGSKLCRKRVCYTITLSKFDSNAENAAVLTPLVNRLQDLVTSAASQPTGELIFFSIEYASKAMQSHIYIFTRTKSL